MGANDARGTNGNRPKPKESSGFDWSRVKGVSRDTRLSWFACDTGALVNLCDAANERGMAVSLASGRAGDFLALTFLDGPNRPRFTYNTIEDADAGIAELLDQLRS